ncbi:MAG: FtsW/RodA/SpoVE family cell cycle protein [Candidatus Paceibacterota bacterium]
MIRINFKNFDWITVGLVVILMSISLVSLASIGLDFFYRQIIWFIIALFIIFFFSQIDWPWFFTQPWFRQSFYWISLLILCIPFIQPGDARGVDSWIFMGGFQFQPSELVKVALIILLAGFFSKRYLAAWQTKNIVVSLLYTFIPVFIIMMQPDAGSAIVVAGIWASFIVMSGINKKRFLVGLLILIVIFAFLWMSVLEPYQKNRIIGFMFPETDPLGTNYNVIQSKIAIGSAGFLGKGFGMGTQVQFNFLPEAQNDFIFAAFVEEWGIFGGVILLLTYSLLIFRIIKTGLKVRRNDLKFFILGVSSVFLIHFFVNIGSNIGLLPVIGINLPFVSYGGSSLLTSSFLISIMERIRVESSS